ncbi:AAA family ATPase [soil metagenome]
MKLGIVGKGGVGKTTLSALLAEAFARRGLRVVAIDTDSNPNLGLSLGLSPVDTDAVPTLPRSILVGSRGDLTVEDVFDQYSYETPAGVTLLSALKVEHAAGGCTCGGHATVRSLLSETLDQRADVTIVDMEAGLEHLSRSGGTLAHADVLLVVMEPSRKAVLTASRTLVLAEELGIPKVYGLGNKAVDGDREFFEDLCAEYGIELAGAVPLDDDVSAAARAGARVQADAATAVRVELDRVIDHIGPLVAV